MGFVVGTESEKMQEKAIQGRYQKVAVGCWYTSTGRSIPQRIKFETEDGKLQQLTNIQVIKSEKKHYAGIYMHRFECRSEWEEKEYCFTLLYHPDTGIWDLIFAEEG